MLKRFCHAACLCMGKNQCWTLKRGGNACKPSLFSPSVYVLYDLLHWIHWGSINSALKYMLLQVTPSPTCIHACTGLQHLKNFKSFFVIFILGLFHNVDIWFFVLGALARSLTDLISTPVSFLLHLLGLQREFLFRKADWVSIQTQLNGSHVNKISLFAPRLGSWFAL